MEDYSFVDVEIKNPVDYIMECISSNQHVDSHDNETLDYVNIEFNEQLQLINLNKHILRKSSSTPSQIKSALQSLLNIIENIKNMYSSVSSLFEKYCNKDKLDKHFEEIFKKFQNQIKNLDSLSATLLDATTKINIAQIREISLAVPKLSAFSAYDRINRFLGYMANYTASIASSPEIAQEIFESNIMFVQVHEISSYLDSNLKKLVPDTMQSFIENYTSLNEYNFNYVASQTLAEQDISDETKEFIAYFDYFYWADDNGKSQIESAWQNLSQSTEINANDSISNDIYLEENNSSLNNQNIEADNSTLDNCGLIIKKENFFTRLFRKIKALFQKQVNETN